MLPVRPPGPSRPQRKRRARAETPPIEYPDAEKWKELNARPQDSSGGVLSLGKLTARVEGLAGTRSLKIDLRQTPSDTDRVVTFHSLGVAPELVVTLANRSQFSTLGWGLALLVGLIGLAMTRRPAQTKIAFLLVVAVLVTLVPLVVDSVEAAYVCNQVFSAVCILAIYYLAADAVRRLVALCCPGCRCCAVSGPACSAVMLMVVCFAGRASADQEATDAKPQTADGPYVIQVVEPSPPVNVPNDAIILPYDPNSRSGVKNANKLLIPYDTYVELWNRAHPDKKIEARPSPARYSLAGAAYKTQLADDDSLLLTGRMEIDVFVDGFLEIPLELGGGVLSRAEFDGKPARLSVPPPLAVSQQPPAGSQQQPIAALQPSGRSILLLHVSGRGPHRLDLAVRLKLSRQGGWRMAEGVLPAAPATALSIVVPQPHTEFRLAQDVDRRSYETREPGETIRTALDPGGAVRLRWRPTVAAGQVDHSLTAASNAVLDVQEDGLRLAWQLGLEFPRNQREQFSIALPAGYLLEKVEGGNVRGWEIRQSDRGQIAEVTLLQPAKDREQFTLRLYRTPHAPREEASVTRSVTSTMTGTMQFDVPQVVVADAALHTGQLTIRRSPLMELRTLSRSGVTRIDLPVAETLDTAASNAEGPLGIQPFEAYSFASVPFRVQLAATPAVAHVSAEVETVLKLSEFQSSLESRITFDVQGRPVYRLQMLLPEDFRLDHVSAPGDFQYAVSRQDKRPLLTIYFAAGQQGDVPVLVRGQLNCGAGVSPARAADHRFAAVPAEKGTGPICTTTNAPRRCPPPGRSGKWGRSPFSGCHVLKYWAWTGSRATWPSSSTRPSTWSPCSWSIANPCC